MSADFDSLSRRCARSTRDPVPAISIPRAHGRPIRRGVLQRPGHTLSTGAYRVTEMCSLASSKVVITFTVASSVFVGGDKEAEYQSKTEVYWPELRVGSAGRKVRCHDDPATDGVKR